VYNNQFLHHKQHLPVVPDAHGMVSGLAAYNMNIETCQVYITDLFRYYPLRYNKGYKAFERQEWD